MKKNTIRFVIITVPPPEVFEVFSTGISKLKKVGNTYTAASYPPHVTLRTGAIVPVSEVDQYIKQFKAHIGDWKAFDIEANGINEESFDEGKHKNYFIYYQIKKSEKLIALHKKLFAFKPYIKSPKKRFLPHLSLAYNNFYDQGYKKAKQYISLYSELFPPVVRWRCDNVSLYYQEGDQWQLYDLFPATDKLNESNLKINNESSI